MSNNRLSLYALIFISTFLNQPLPIWFRNYAKFPNQKLNDVLYADPKPIASPSGNARFVAGQQFHTFQLGRATDQVQQNQHETENG